MKTLLALLFSSPPLWAMPPDGNAPGWYYPQWLADASHAPVFKMRDPVNRYGRYASEPEVITIKDLIKFHGHFCGGLVEGATALKVVKRVSTGQSVGVVINAATYPHGVRIQMKKIESGKFTPADINLFQDL